MSEQLAVAMLLESGENDEHRKPASSSVSTMQAHGIHMPFLSSSPAEVEGLVGSYILLYRRMTD